MVNWTALLGLVHGVNVRKTSRHWIVHVEALYGRCPGELFGLAKNLRAFQIYDRRSQEENSFKIAFKLKNLISEKDFVIDPASQHFLFKYEAWPWKKILEEERNLSKLEFEYIGYSDRITAVFFWVAGITIEFLILRSLV